MTGRADRTSIFDMVALIPARAGSQRIPGKNRKLFCGHPLIAYTLATARACGLFRDIWVCSDDPAIAPIAQAYGAEWCWRDPVPADQADIVWVTDVLTMLTSTGRRPMAFAILRPTSPFRTVAMLTRASRQFYAYLSADSLRAVEPVTQHPGKMWTWEGPSYPIKPLLTRTRPDGVPWHSSPTQSLPTVFVQNASLEMAWTRNVEAHGSISGASVVPFFCEGYEGLDLNTPRDWRDAEALVAEGAAVLPTLPVAPMGAAAPTVDGADPDRTVAG